MTLLSLASRQIWPQVLAVAHLKPERLFLLHSEDTAESKGPAQRLKRFFDDSGLVPRGGTGLHQVSDADFDAIERALDELQTREQLPLADCRLNFTGGNKLMATAAFRWAVAANRGVRAFYLERRNQLTWFEPRENEVHTSMEPITASATNGLDPTALLACQFGEGAIAFDGERLTLHEKAKEIPWAQVNAHLRRDVRLDHGGFDFRKWLVIENPCPVCRGEREPEGRNLEYAVAYTLLRLEVPNVRRSVELKPSEQTSLSEGELDLVFNWDRRLWVVDCKDKASGHTKLENLRTALVGQGVNLGSIEKHLLPIQHDIEDKEIKILREDLAQISEVGGLLGNALAVRSADLPAQARQFAQSRRPKVEVIIKHALESRLRALLHPRQSASLDQIHPLTAARTRATA